MTQGSPVKQTIKAFMHSPVGCWLISTYLRLVSATSRHVYDPPDPEGRFGQHRPVIYATWHGQNFIFAFRFRRKNFPTLLVATHGDGKMVGTAMSLLGVPLVFGSGSTEKGRSDKGGARAFLKLLKELRRGQSVTLTADVPKRARVVGEGIVLLARKSGAPIVPVAMATSRRKILKTWDRMQLNLPFSKMVFVEGPEIHVPDDGSALDIYREQLHQALETAHQRACELADSRP